MKIIIDLLLTIGAQSLDGQYTSLWTCGFHENGAGGEASDAQSTASCRELHVAKPLISASPRPIIVLAVRMAERQTRRVRQAAASLPG